MFSENIPKCCKLNFKNDIYIYNKILIGIVFYVFKHTYNKIYNKY